MIAALMLLALVNGQRALHHEHSLRLLPSVAHCTEFQPLDCVQDTGLRTNSVGVITATGFETPAEMIHAWLRSPPHRAIMLDPAYRLAGPSLVGDVGRVVFAQ